MAKLTEAPARDTIDKLAGVIDFYDWKGIHCVRRWPAKPRGARSPMVQAQYSPFRYINKLAGHLPDYIVAQWRAMVLGANITWKDLLVRAYLGATYQPQGLPKTIPYYETQAHFAILQWQAVDDGNAIDLTLVTDVPCRLWLVRLDALPIRRIHTTELRGNRNYHDIWWYYEAQALESPAEADDSLIHQRRLLKAIPHYSRGIFFAATQNDLWMKSVSQYWTPSDLGL